MGLLWLIVFILIIFILLGALPRRFNSPVDIVVFIIILVLILWLMGVLH